MTDDVDVRLLVAYIVGGFLLIMLMVYLDYYSNPCRHYKPDASLVAEIGRILHKDPKLSSLLVNNNYTIDIIEATTYPYIENGETKCLVTEARVRILFDKPIHVISHGLITQEYWTYGFIVDVVLDNRTLEINGDEIKIHG